MREIKRKEWESMKQQFGDFIIYKFVITDAKRVRAYFYTKAFNPKKRPEWYRWLSEDEARELMRSEAFRSAKQYPKSKKHPYGFYRVSDECIRNEMASKRSKEIESAKQSKKLRAKLFRELCSAARSYNSRQVWPEERELNVSKCELISAEGERKRPTEGLNLGLRKLSNSMRSDGSYYLIMAKKHLLGENRYLKESLSAHSLYNVLFPRYSTTSDASKASRFYCDRFSIEEMRWLAWKYVDMLECKRSGDSDKKDRLTKHEDMIIVKVSH